jgi:hypothetical protein
MKSLPPKRGQGACLRSVLLKAYQMRDAGDQENPVASGRAFHKEKHPSAIPA